MANKFNEWLNNVDDKADNNGKKTIWQIVKFIVVSLLVTIIQLALVNLLYFFMKNWQEPLPGFLGEIFSPSTVGEGHSNWGYILPFFLSNFIANTVGYFLNKRKTFKSDAPLWHYIIYIVLLFLLILFSTWLQGLVVNALISVNFESLAPTIAAMVAGTVQMIVLFPLQKFVLLREKKKAVTM
jgi:putative flippase GtrA